MLSSAKREQVNIMEKSSRAMEVFLATLQGGGVGYFRSFDAPRWEPGDALNIKQNMILFIIIIFYFYRRVAKCF